MGRLILNVLLSFAQFEREIISERKRDKIAATRHRRKWAGGHPILGYDVDPQGFRFNVNAAEGERVRAIFKLYLEQESLLPVVLELEKLGWKNKEWATRKGPQKGGKPFTRTSLYKLLTNVVYTGKVRFRDEVHDGEHPAIVYPSVRQARSGREIFTKPNGSSIGGVLSGSGPSLLAKRKVISYDTYRAFAKCNGREKTMNVPKGSRTAWPRRSNSRRC